MRNPFKKAFAYREPEFTPMEQAEMRRIEYRERIRTGASPSMNRRGRGREARAMREVLKENLNPRG